VPAVRYRHLAIHVPDVRAAEVYYCGLFDLAVMFREAPIPDTGADGWAQLRPDKGWAEAETAGVDIGMVAMGRGDFVLVLFPGQPTPGQVFAVGVVMTEEEIAGVRSRLTDDTQVLSSEPGWLDFVDPYQLHWQLARTPRFVGSGEAADRWLDM
jgi:hypothetical protein